jgi:hypothetical protein
MKGMWGAVKVDSRWTLRMNGRISMATWLNWRDGIQSNLGRPAFARVWDRIKKGTTGSFTELRRLEASGFSDDPREWISVSKRLLHC